MSRLERLGLEVAAFNLLGHRGKAALLCALIEARGRVVPYDTLKQARAWRWVEYSDLSYRGLQARICWLRSALEDVGLPGVVCTGPKEGRNHKAEGYFLPEPGRTLVINRLIAEAS